MPKYTENFIFNIRKIDLVEHAVREQIVRLSSENLADHSVSVEHNERKIRELHKLLESLHNKKSGTPSP